MAHSALRTWTRPASPRGEGQPERGPRSGEVLGSEVGTAEALLFPQLRCFSYAKSLKEIQKKAFALQ